MKQTTEKKALLFLTLFLLSFFIYAQNPKVVMHLQSSDTMVHKSIVNQVKNLKNEIPNAEVAIICHGPGLTFLQKESGSYATKIDKMKLSGVTLAGCEFTMKQKNISKEDLVPFASTVPFALVDIIKRQNEGWLYVKVGF